IPVVAIGGITLDNAHELKDTGIAGLSVVSAIMSAENPKKASEELLNIFNS
ncbi:MAG: thiamine phosphate synthase, partial [Methanobrevibacter sp.]|nr:thiamine phosphate synthase [Methanobrevibacter sp.]